MVQILKKGSEQKTIPVNRIACVMWSDGWNPNCKYYAEYEASNGEPLCPVCNHINNRILKEKRR